MQQGREKAVKIGALQRKALYLSGLYKEWHGQAIALEMRWREQKRGYVFALVEVTEERALGEKIVSFKTNYISANRMMDFLDGIEKGLVMLLVLEHDSKNRRKSIV